MEQVNNQVIEVLEYICKKFGMAIDWTSDNVLPYVKDLIGRIAQYEFYSSIILACAGFMVFIACVVVLCKTMKRWRKDIKEGEFIDEYIFIPSAIGMIVAGMGIIMSLVLTCVEIEDVIEAKCLPEVAAIKYIQETSQYVNN